MANNLPMPISLSSTLTLPLAFIQHETNQAPKNNHRDSEIPSFNAASAGTSIGALDAMTPQTDPIASNAEPASPEDISNEVETTPKLRIAIIMACLCACIFVAAIDVTIISPALPAIASHFHSSSSYQWVASAYVLGSTATTPSWGNVSNIWGRKPILLLSLIFFFVGSLICALGQSMGIFLAGRAVQGVGASGLLTLVNISISDLFSLRDRSFYYGLTSVVWALASGIGPVLGGVFAQQLTFRWCFWMNLPISGVVFVFLIVAYPQDNPGTPVLDGLRAIDWSGSVLIVGGTLMLLLGLNFGGVTFSWSSATVINLIVFGVFAGFLFGLNEWKLVKYPVIPPRLFRKRSSFASFAVCFFHGIVLMGIAYYLPLYFQSVLGAGALLSGVYLLPFIITNTVMAAATGIYIQMTGKYIYAVYLGLGLMVLGTGLLFNLDFDSNWPKIVLYQMIAGAGVGMNFEGPLLSLQATLGTEDVATATATFGFTRTLSTAISAIIGGVVFQNQMLKESSMLVASLGPAVASQFQGGDATASVEVIRTLPVGQRIIARGAYLRSFRSMWIMYAAFAGVSLLTGLFIAVHPLSKEHQTVQIGLVENRNAANSDGPPDGIESEEGTRGNGGQTEGAN